MEEKSIWMFLFFGLLILCLAMTIFLLLNSGGVDCKKKYSELKASYADLALAHSKLLENVNITQTDLASGISDYKNEGQLKTKIQQWQNEASTMTSDFKSEEELRRKIVELQIQAENFQKKN
jgi:hypothetical protein